MAAGFSAQIAPSSGASGAAYGGGFSGGANGTGDFIVGGTKSGLSNTVLYVAAGLVGLGLVVWLVRRK